jgi:hypothetical protein
MKTMHDKAQAFVIKSRAKGRGNEEIAFALLSTALAMLQDGDGFQVTQAIVTRVPGTKRVQVITPRADNHCEIVPDMPRPAPNEEMMLALEVAQMQFMFYGESHHAKNTTEGELKAFVNAGLAAMCARAIGMPLTRRPVRLAPGWPIAAHMPFMAAEALDGVTFEDFQATDRPEISPVQHDSPVSGAPVPLDVAAHDAVLAMRARMNDAVEWMAIPDDKTGFFHEGLDQHLAVIEKFFAAGGKPDLVTWIMRKANFARMIGHSDIGAAFEALAAEMGHGLEEQPVDLEKALRLFYEDCHGRNVKAGWWTDLSNGSPKNRSVGELFMLIVTELWEAYDAYVNGSHDDKLPEFPGIGVELGDVQIRVADFAGALMAGRIVENTGAANEGDLLFCQVGEIAKHYEKIRKTDAAKGEPETGAPLEPMDVARMTFAKLDFNATRKDHTIEERLKEGGKRT